MSRDLTSLDDTPYHFSTGEPFSTKESRSEPGKISRENQSIQKVSQEIFQARSSPGITYSRSDKLQSGLVKTVKWLFFPITVPISYIFKKAARTLSMADASTKHVNQDNIVQLQALGGEPILFKSEDGCKLEGMFFKNPSAIPSAKTILVCSGSHSSSEQYNVPIVRALLAMGHNVMTFNYRGFGNSEGKASESGLYKDGEAAYQYLQHKQIENKDIVIYGYSLGGAVASELAARHEVDVVLDRTFSSGADQAAEVAQQMVPKGGLNWLARLVAFTGCRFDNVNKLKYMKGRVFIYQETLENRHDTFLKRMQNAVSRARKASLESLQNSGSVVTAYGMDDHFHKETTLWFGKSVHTEDKEKLRKFLL